MAFTEWAYTAEMSTCLSSSTYMFVYVCVCVFGGIMYKYTYNILKSK